MYTFIIIFAVAFALGMYFVLKENSTEPEVTPSESTLEEPDALPFMIEEGIVVEEPVVVIGNEVVDVKPVSKPKKKKYARKKPTTPPKAKQSKN